MYPANATVGDMRNCSEDGETLGKAAKARDALTVAELEALSGAVTGAPWGACWMLTLAVLPRSGPGTGRGHGGRVQRRQQQRWAARDATSGMGKVAAPPVAGDPLSTQMAQLAQVGGLKAAGMLTEAEFQQKALIPGHTPLRHMLAATMGGA